MAKMAAIAAAALLAAGAIGAAPAPAKSSGAAAARGDAFRGGRQIGTPIRVDRFAPSRRGFRGRPAPRGDRIIVDRRPGAGPFPSGLLDLPGSPFVPDDRHRRRGGGDFGFYSDGYYDGGYGVQDPHGYRDYGYFSGPGAAGAEASGGKAHYDYDRGYPYDHYDAGEEADGEGVAYAESVRRCRLQWTTDRRTRAKVQVRICSN